MTKRIFPYREDLVSETIDLGNPKIQVEIIGDSRHVNLGVVGGRPSDKLALSVHQNATWISLQGKTLDDLITALEYVRLKLNKQEEN